MINDSDDDVLCLYGVSDIAGGDDLFRPHTRTDLCYRSHTHKSGAISRAAQVWLTDYEVLLWKGDPAWRQGDDTELGNWAERTQVAKHSENYNSPK